MKWLKKLFCKLFGCKCGCQEGKECSCQVDVNKINVDTITVNSKNVKKEEAKKSASKPKKKVTKKTNKKAKK